MRLSDFESRLRDDPLQVTLPPCLAVLVDGDALRHLKNQTVQLRLIVHRELTLEHLYVKATAHRREDVFLIVPARANQFPFDAAAQLPFDTGDPLLNPLSPALDVRGTNL